MLHLRALRKRAPLGMPEDLRPGPQPKSRRIYYLLLFGLFLFFLGLYFYHFHLLVKGSGLVVGEVLNVRAPFKGEVVSVPELGSAFEPTDSLLSLKPYRLFDEEPFLEEKREALEASYEVLNAERWNLLREKDSLQKRLLEAEALYRQRLLTLPEKLSLLSALRTLEAQILGFEQSLRRLDVELLEIEKRLAEVKKKKEAYLFKAPEKGFVLEKLVAPGSLVFPGDYLLRLSCGPPKYILAYFSLKDAPYIYPGLKLKVRLERGTVFEGIVREILKETAYKPPYLLRTFEKRTLALQALIEIPGMEETKLLLREPVWVSFRRPFLWFR